VGNHVVISNQTFSLLPKHMSSNSTTVSFSSIRNKPAHNTWLYIINSNGLPILSLSHGSSLLKTYNLNQAGPLFALHSSAQLSSFSLNKISCSRAKIIHKQFHEVVMFYSTSQIHLSDSFLQLKLDKIWDFLVLLCGLPLLNVLSRVDPIIRKIKACFAYLFC
jgi:hypothetical protein